MAIATDHSTAGAIIGGTLKKKGYGGGIIRYACPGRGSVNITPKEVADLRANGIPIGIVLEHEADWLLRAGVSERTKGCIQITRACGLPDGVIYAAADWDCTNGGPTRLGSPGDKNMQGIARSLHVMAEIAGEKNVGFYGSKFGIDALRVLCPWLEWYWQTLAWSHGARSAYACLFQRAQQDTVAGVQVDIDDILKENWGQRGMKPLPGERHGHLNFAGSYFGNEHGGDWTVHGTASTDSVFGSATAPEKWARAEHAICVQGPRRGQHHIKPLDWG